MLDTLKLMAVGFPVFVVVDFVWIGLVANGFYKSELGALARRSGENFDPRLAPAAVLYALIVLGIAVFVLPRVQQGSLWDAARFGALFGFIGYGVYDLTSYAVINGFTLRMTVVDMIWGACLCALTAVSMQAAKTWMS
ncbi:MAG: DUF2177 family protein [Vicinamibacterales bacterium]|nr:DUF2177 family protein [Vicinamibacterales bacterium]